MTFELTVKGQFSFRHRERGWKYSVGGRNSKGTDQGIVPYLSSFSEEASLIKGEHRKRRKPGFVCPLYARISTKCFTSVNSLNLYKSCEVAFY